nr:nucleobase-ascorbate transporter 2-like [Aegilops tauschii subsp. strangulata]
MPPLRPTLSTAKLRAKPSDRDAVSAKLSGVGFLFLGSRTKSSPSVNASLADFQHYILALGTAVMIPAVLVPMKGGSDMSAPLRFLIRATPHGLAPRITSFSANNLWWCSRLAISDGLQGDRVRVVQTLLFVTGINTLLQSLFGTQLPSVIGGSYAFLIPVMAIMQDSSLAAIPDEHERFLQSMRAIQGAVIVSSSIQIILGYSQLWGIFSRFFSPLGMAPVVALLGFGFFERGFLVVGRCVEVGLPMLILFVVLYQNVQIREIPILERFSLFICIALVWAYAQILTSGGAYNHFVLPLVVNAV